MTSPADPSNLPAKLPAERVVSPDSIERSLLDVIGRALQTRGRSDLDPVRLPNRPSDPTAPLTSEVPAPDVSAGSVPEEDTGCIDADAVAEWIISRYPSDTYPAVVLGSPHGAAAHLAASLGGPWLPTGFPLRVRWDGALDDWRGAYESGAAAVDRIVAANPDVTVRQVHDPVRDGALCASALTLHVRWRRLPPAYRGFLHNRLTADGQSMLLREARTWPVLDRTSEHGFQVGSPVSGCRPEDYTMDNRFFAELMYTIGGDAWRTPPLALPRRYAEPAGEPQLEPELRRIAAESRRRTHRVLYPNPETLSACVADLYRGWLAGDRSGPQQCVVEMERVLDPSRVLISRAVPYWCESTSDRAVSAAEWWLAGSEPFDHVDVLPAPPAVHGGTYAGLRRWRALTSFGRQGGDAHRETVGGDPSLSLPTGHATPAPSNAGGTPPMRLEQLLRGLRSTGQGSGLMVL